jgi:hypothetical protein
LFLSPSGCNEAGVVERPTKRAVKAAPAAITAEKLSA